MAEPTSRPSFASRLNSFITSFLPTNSWRTATFWMILLVNLALIVLYFWSLGGASTDVRIEAIGPRFTAFVDGQEVAARPFNAEDQGGIGFVLARQYRLPALPEPYGIEFVRVTDADSGDVLFEDDFEGEMSPLWDNERDTWVVKDGLLTTDEEPAITTGPQPWEDVIVEAEFRNITESTTYVRLQDTKNTVALGIGQFRNFGGASLGHVEDGEAIDRADTRRLEVDRTDTLKSITAMVLRPYPYAILLFMGVVAVAFVVRVRWLERLLQSVGRFVPDISPGIVIGLAAGVGVLLWYLLYVLGDAMPHVPDSVAYMFQSKIFASFNAYGEAPPARESFSFFHPHMLQVVDDRWFTHYPFGHPLFLSFGEMVGRIPSVPAVPWLVPPVLGAASVAMIYWVGKRMHGVAVGLIAAVLLASSPFFLMTASNFMSHNTAAFTLIGALFLMTMPTKWRVPAMFLAGVLIGLLFNIRPLTAAAFLPVLAVFMAFELLRASPGASDLVKRQFPADDKGVLNLLALLAMAALVAVVAILWIQGLGPIELQWYIALPLIVPALAVAGIAGLPLVRESTPRRQLLLEDIAFATGAALLFGAYLLYNRVTTGSFTTSAYEVQGTFSENFFGFSGFHSLTLGLQNEQELLSLFLLVANGWPLVIGLVFAGFPFLLGSRNKWDYFVGASFLAIAASPMFYASSAIMHGPRFWYESLPFFILLSARGVQILAVSASATADWFAARIQKSPTISTTGVASLATYCIVAGLVAFSLYSWLLGQRNAWGDEEIGVHTFTPESAADLEGFNFTDDRLLEEAVKRDIHNALIFVDYCPQWWCYGSVFWTNSPELDTDIVWAERQESEDDLVLLEIYGDREIYEASFARRTISETTPEQVLARVEERQEEEPTAVPPSVTTTPEERDAQRKADLEEFAGMLTQYYEQNGSIPSTDGQRQSLCAYRTLDVGCALEEIAPIPTEPLGEAIMNGYWWYSTEDTYILVAKRETELDSTNGCPDDLLDEEIANERYCLEGSLP